MAHFFPSHPLGHRGRNLWHPPARPGRPAGLRRGRLAGLSLLAALVLVQSLPVAAGVLDRVKTSPTLAQGLCSQFRQWNASSRSAYAAESIAAVAAREGITTVDAEVLTTYVIDFHCKDVR